MKKRRTLLEVEYSCIYTNKVVPVTSNTLPAQGVMIPDSTIEFTVFKYRQAHLYQAERLSSNNTNVMGKHRKAKRQQAGDIMDNSYQGTNGLTPKGRGNDGYNQSYGRLGNHSISSTHLRGRSSSHLPPWQRHHDTSKPRRNAVGVTATLTCPLRDFHHQKYHKTIRSIFAEGSVLQARLCRYLDNLKGFLQSDPDEMDWEISNQILVVRESGSVPHDGTRHKQSVGLVKPESGIVKADDAATTEGGLPNMSHQDGAPSSQGWSGEKLLQPAI